AGQASLGVTVEPVLAGAFAGLIVAVVVAAMFISAEYRRGMIRTTVTASPRRGRILVAKAIVIGAAAFVAALAAAATVVPLGEGMERRNGNVVYPVAPLTEVRVVAGTAALIAVAAVLALAIGAILRRSARHRRHRGDRLAVHPRAPGRPARRRGAVAAADPPGRRLRDPAEPSAIPAGEQRLHPAQRLLSAGAVGRFRGAVRLRRARPG